MKMQDLKNRSKSLLHADTISDIIKDRHYLIFHPKAKVELIAREMQRRNEGVACIIDQDRTLVGIVTERDILRKIFGRHGESREAFEDRQTNLSTLPGTLTAWDVLVPDPVCLYDDMPVEDALDTIRQHGYRFMPVVSRKDKNKLCGIVSERELFWRTQDKVRRLIAEKDTLLSYFMHHEPYGFGSVISQKDKVPT